MKFKFFSTVFFLLLCFSNASASTTSWVCKFPLEATPKGVAKPSSPFELRYIQDAGTKKSYLMGNNGSAEVQVIPNADGVSFIEVTSSGNVMVTAIALNGDAVHSRSGIFFKEIVPSQYYGKCTKQ